MLKNKFNRHTIAFLTIALASILLYPAAQAGLASAIWLLLGLVILAAITDLNHKMSKPSSPIDVLITMPFGTSLIKPLQEVSPLLRITVHPAKNVNEVPDELWARCEVLYTNRILPDAELAPNIKWVQHH